MIIHICSATDIITMWVGTVWCLLCPRHLVVVLRSHAELVVQRLAAVHAEGGGEGAHRAQ